MNIAKTITIKEVSDNKTDKNGRTYRTVTVETSDVVKVIDEATGKTVETVGNQRTAVLTTYEKRYLDDKPDNLWGREEGTVLLGDIVTMAVEAYPIDDRMVNKYTTVVLGNSSDPNTWMHQIFSTFRSNGHRCLGDPTPENVDPETGEIKVPQNKAELELDDTVPGEEVNDAIPSAEETTKKPAKTTF